MREMYGKSGNSSNLYRMLLFHKPHYSYVPPIFRKYIQHIDFSIWIFEITIQAFTMHYIQSLDSFLRGIPFPSHSNNCNDRKYTKSANLRWSNKYQPSYINYQITITIKEFYVKRYSSCMTWINNKCQQTNILITVASSYSLYTNTTMCFQYNDQNEDLITNYM